MRRLLLGMLLLYQRLCSPFLPSCCRFYPSCSEYAARALQVHGPLHGGLLAFWRLLRCHPLAQGGLDPVPEPNAQEPGSKSQTASSALPGNFLCSNQESSISKSR
ncbi:MAG: membrane protein insertion efficiency factor YidD [Desulfohalobiaceae bacterium]